MEDYTMDLCEIFETKLEADVNITDAAPIHPNYHDDDNSDDYMIGYSL